MQTRGPRAFRSAATGTVRTLNAGVARRGEGDACSSSTSSLLAHPRARARRRRAAGAAREPRRRSSGSSLGGLAAFWLVPLVNDVLAVAEHRACSPWCSPSLIVLVIGGATAGGAIGGALRRGVDRSRRCGCSTALLGGALAVLAGALSLSLVSASVVPHRAPGDLLGARLVAGAAHDRGAHAAAGRGRARAACARRCSTTGSRSSASCSTLDVQPSTPPVRARRSRARRRPRHPSPASRASRSRAASSATGSGFVARSRPRRDERARRRRRRPPVVELPGRPAREGRIVYFDPVDDLAVIAVDGLGRRAAPGRGAARRRARPRSCRATRSADRSRWCNAEVLSAGAVLVPDIYGMPARCATSTRWPREVQPGQLRRPAAHRRTAPSPASCSPARRTTPPAATR